jgi:hypothetical protein
MHSRNHYIDGVYKFDLAKVNQVSVIKARLEETGINTNVFEFKKLLLILDNCDCLIKETLSSFLLLLKYYT